MKAEPHIGDARQRATTTTTPVSGSIAARSREHLTIARCAALARASLVVVSLGISSVGCLTLGSPTYDAQQETPPILISAAADPPLNQIIVLNLDGDTGMGPTQLSTEVISEDADQALAVEILVDYGDPDFDHPFSTGIQPVVAASTLAAGPRPVTALFEWNPWLRTKMTDKGLLDYGCHTLTLMTTHGDFQPDSCPTCLADSAQMTWIVVKCDSTNQDHLCNDISNLDPLNACPLLGSTPQWTTGCPTDQSTDQSCGSIVPTSGGT
jgi:hypothetical protein